MEKNTSTKDTGEDNFSWETKEYEPESKNRSWIISFYILTSILLLYSLFTGNFLFAVIIILAVIIITIHSHEEPLKININLNDEGLWIGKKFHDFDEFESFAIVYKPKREIKNLYFEPKSKLKQRISIPLEDINPLRIQKFLSQYLPEDTDRTDPPLSEQLARFFNL